MAESRAVFHGFCSSASSKLVFDCNMLLLTRARARLLKKAMQFDNEPAFLRHP